MKTKVFYALVGLLCLFFTEKASAFQSNETDTLEKNDSYKPVNLNLTIKNMHLWRGYRVTSGAMSAVDLNYQSKNQHFKAGIWGGAGFDGEYREFDYYVGFKYDRWALDVWDINNFSDYPNAKIFDYSRANTSHFIDVTLSYQLSKIRPVNLSWSTIVTGRDNYINDNNELKSAFSNFVNLEYSLIYKGDDKLSVFAGYAFSFLNKANFYGSKPNFVSIGLNYTKNLKVFNHVVPVGAKAMWNPEQGYGGLQFSIQPF
ncbi:MAG TPA: hypothetical protein VF273_11890 [Pelobium sp.]